MVSAGPCEGVRPILFKACAPGWNRTSDNPLRRRVLYPTELQAHLTPIKRWCVSYGAIVPSKVYHYG